MKYGMPFKGSKNSICNWLMSVLPCGDTFVDLFAGGGAVTHAAILSGKYKSYIMNDAHPGLTTMFVDAIKGKYSNNTEWVSRKEFFDRKDTDPFIATVWSFENNMSDYLYGENRENFAHDIHVMLTAQTFTERRLKWRKVLNYIVKNFQNVDNNGRVQHLERIARVQSLENLDKFENLCGNITALSVDFASVDIPKNSVVYCDIPYNNTRKDYYVKLDYDRFYTWLRDAPFVVYVSEYTMPSDFVSIASINKVVHCTGSGKRPENSTERVFVHERFAEQEIKRLKMEKINVREN